MQTRKALARLTNGKAAGERVDSPLAKNASKYLGEYEMTEQSILDKKEELSVAMPFVNAIKKKMASVENQVDSNIPVVASFDLYTSISKIARRSTKDSGLKRLATHLEKIWHNDPLGALTYGQVESLVRMYKDQFPKSAASDAIEAECARVGMHKLPVARLSRIAAKVDSQETYDQLIRDNGLDGTKAEHVKSRAFIRGLVAMRIGADVGEESVSNRLASVSEVIADKIASFDKDAGYVDALETLKSAAELAKQLQQKIDSAAMGMHEDGVSMAGASLDELGKKLDEWVASLAQESQKAQVQPDVKPIMPPAKPEEPKVPEAPSHSTTPPTKMKGPKQKTPEELAGLQKKWFDPRTWSYGEQAEQAPAEPSPEDLAGLKRKWYDPRTWSYGKTSELISTARQAALDTDDAELSYAIDSLVERLAQVLPSMQDDEQEMPLDDGLEMQDDAPMLPEMSGDGVDIDQSDLETGVEMVQEIQEVAEDIVQDAPPQAADYIQHEMSEGHTAPPGTAEWGAEEILNEGHTAPPPSEQWLEEEMRELGAKKAQYKTYSGPLSVPEFREQMQTSRPDIFPDRRHAPLRIEDTGAGGADPEGNPIEPYLEDDAMGEDAELGSIEKMIDELEFGVGDTFDPDDSEFLTQDGPSDEFLSRGGRRAQAGGPNMLQDQADDVPMASPGDVTEMEQWPEQDIVRQIQDLKQQGLDEGKIVNQLVEMGVMGTSQPMAQDIENYLAPLVRQSARGKSIPLPKGKIKSQPHVTTYAKKPADGAKALRADLIEDSLLAGDTVKVGSVSMFINGNDEIELWNKTSGVACNLDAMDRAISDFIKLAEREVAEVRKRSAANRFAFNVTEVVAVPCQGCSAINVFPRVAKASDYRCSCGNMAKKATVESLLKIVANRAYKIDVKYPTAGQDARNRVINAIMASSGGSFKVDDEDPRSGYLTGTIWNTDEITMEKVSKKLQMLGGVQTEVRRVAQMAQPPAQPAAPAMPAAAPAGDSEQALPQMPIQELANAAFMNYKAQGLTLPEAMQAFLREHKERLSEWNPAADGDLMGAIAANFTSSMPAAAQPQSPAQPGMQMGAAAKAAQSKMKVPSVRKPKDHVSAPKSPGKDTEQDDSLPSPGKVKQQHKPSGKMSPKELGKDSETQDLMTMPKEKPRTHIESPSGSKFSDKDLGEDSELNDDMHVPARGEKPSVKR